ncbi:MAG: peroxiredoxin-like family protein [Bacteroidota bacterium]
MNAAKSLSISALQDIISNMQTQNKETVGHLSSYQPVLLVFLRHFGCTFCREALADIAKRRASIEKNGIKIIFVHMSEHKLAERYFNRYELAGIDHVSDPTCQYYAAFGLTKGNFTQLFGLKSWVRGFQAGVLDGHLIGTQLGDGFQMPGVFVISKGKIQNSFIHKIASDRPDYESLVQCCVLPAYD